MELPLDAKTQLLVALGAAVAAKCQKCFTKLYPNAERVGASDKEIRAVVAIAAKVAEKSRQFMAAFVDEATRGAVQAPGEGGTGGGGCGCAAP